MSNTLILKRSGTANAQPAVGNLVLGELAINTFDGRLYTKIDSGVPSIFELTQNQPISLLGNITGTSTNYSNGTSQITTTLSNTGVSAGTYGGTSGATAYVGQFTVDQYGRISNASNIAISTASLSNGTSNIVVYSNGNVAISSAGTSNVAVFSSQGEYIDGFLSVTGNITTGNLGTAGNVSANGFLSDNYYYANGTPLDFSQPAGANTEIQFNDGAGGFGASGNLTFNYATNLLSVNNGNVSVGSGNVDALNFNGNVFGTTVSVTGNIDSSNVNANIYATTVSASGNITAGNITTTGASGNITGANVISATTLSATGNINAGNLTSAGTVDFISAGNISLGNVGNLHIGGGSNGYVLTTNGSGDLTWEVTGSPTIIQNGLSNVTIPIANGNVLINSNNGIDYVWNFDETGNLTTPGNINALAGNVDAQYFNGNVVGTTVSVTGNITSSNVNANVYATTVSASGNIDGANINANLYATTASVSGNIIGSNVNANVYATTVSASGNIFGANVISGVTLSASGNVVANTVVASANIDGANVNVTNTLYTPNVASAGDLNLSTFSNGNINLFPNGSGNIVLANTYVNGVAYPAQDQDAASKLYVDTVATTGFTFHAAVFAATASNLATATGGTITYNEPNGAGNGIGATLTTTGSFDLIDTANIQTIGTRVLVKDEPNGAYNGVYTWANSLAIVRSTDADQYGADSTESFSINDYFFTTNGNVNAGAAFIVSAPAGTITFGTSNIQFAEFSRSQVYSANVNAGLSLIGQQFNARVDNNTTAFDNFGNIIVKASANLTTPNIGAAVGNSVSVTGNITGGNLITAGNVYAPAIVNNGTYNTKIELGAASGIIAVTTDGNATQFLPGGQIRLAPGGAKTILSGTLDGSQLVLGTSQTDLVQNRSGNVTVQVGASGATTSTWTFANSGDLLAPGNISAVGNVIAGNITTVGIANIATIEVTTLANIKSTTPSTSNVTGAVKVAGGIGVTGNVYADGMYVYGDSVLTINSTIDGGTY